MPVSMMNQSTDIAKFSPCGSRLSVCGADGRLSIWKVGGVAAEQVWLPSHHLEAVTSCLAWEPSSGGDHAGKRKKKKKEKSSTEGGGGAGSDLLALGTSAGSLLLYSVRQAAQVAAIKKETTSKINAVTWSNNRSHIYAVSEDGTISSYSTSKQCHLSTWFCPPNSPLHSVCISPCDSLLAVSSHNITLFPLSSPSSPPSPLLNLTGHAQPTTSLAFTPSSLLVSGARGERTLSVWDTKQGGALLGLACNEGVIDVLATSQGVTAVTEGGAVLVFRLPNGELESKSKKPVTASHRLCLTSPKDGVSGKVSPIPILAAKLEGSHDLGIAYGSIVRPVLEKVELSDLKVSEAMVREVPSLKLATQQEINPVVTPKTEGDVTFLAPGAGVPTGGLGKRKQPSAPPPNQDSLPVEQRLSLLGSQGQQESTDTPPRTDTLAQLLTQGLHSNDPRILNSVLDRADPDLISNTVRLLPAEAVVPLVTTLQRFIKGRGVVNASHAKWLKSVLTIHTGYLVSIPDCQDLLSPVYALLEKRTSHYSQVLQLKGKLELLTKQSEAKEGDKIIDTEKEALLVYQDDSSDELENVIDDLLVPGSASDDQWTDEEDNEKEMEADDETDSDSVEIVNGDAESEDEDMESDDD